MIFLFISLLIVCLRGVSLSSKLVRMCMCVCERSSAAAPPTPSLPRPVPSPYLHPLVPPLPVSQDFSDAAAVTAAVTVEESGESEGL